MKKRLLKSAIATALTLAVAAPVFAATAPAVTTPAATPAKAPVAKVTASANPFSDVPAKHWAYDAVNKLAQAGIIDGYGDGTFRGDKTMTRYEMATIIGKAMTKSLNADQKNIVEKLSKEFGAELNTLGVKVAGLEKQVNDMVKFSGDARVRYYNADLDNGTDGYKSEYRVRLGATAKINDDTNIYARITSGSTSIETGNAQASIDNAYVNTKILGADARIGRQDFEIGQGLLAGADNVAVLNGVKITDGKFMAFVGKELKDATTFAQSYGAQYSFNAGLPVTAGYLNLNDKEYFSAGTSFNLVPGLKMAAEYANNTTDKAEAYQVKATLGNSGLSVAYKNIEQNALPFESNQNIKSSGVANLKDFYALSTTGNVKGLEYSYNRVIAKNTNLNVMYQDINDYGKNFRATASVKF